MSKDEVFCVEERKNRCVLARDRAEEVRYFIHLEGGEECREDGSVRSIGGFRLVREHVSGVSEDGERKCGV